MIVDYLINKTCYEGLIPQLSEIKELAEQSLEKPCGRYETDWGFYMIQEGMTSPLEDGKFESHRKYIDVQCLISGEEYMEWQNISKLKLVQPYCEEKDFQLMCGEGKRLQISKGMFYIMFPEDGHKACCHIHHASAYRKLVAKIKL